MAWWDHSKRRPESQLDRIECGINRLLALAGETQRRELIMANELQDILDRVTAQKGQIASIKQLVIDLKAHQNDPAKLAEIVAGLDENSVEMAVIANPEPPTT